MAVLTCTYAHATHTSTSHITSMWLSMCMGHSAATINTYCTSGTSVRGTECTDMSTNINRLRTTYCTVWLLHLVRCDIIPCIWVQDMSRTLLCLLNASHITSMWGSMCIDNSVATINTGCTSGTCVRGTECTDMITNINRLHTTYCTVWLQHLLRRNTCTCNWVQDMSRTLLCWLNISYS